jgi:CheY-specific phosphatase CheX
MNSEILNGLMRQAGSDLFASTPLTLRADTRADPTAGLSIRLASVIGFTGFELRGSLMLAMSEGALQAALPTKHDLPHHWIAELANQLLGRIKNQLARYEVDVALSTPVVIRGERIAPCMDGDQTPLVWSFDQGTACGWFDCEIKDGFELRMSSNAALVAEEGASLLF